MKGGGTKGGNGIVGGGTVIGCTLSGFATSNVSSLELMDERDIASSSSVTTWASLLTHGSSDNSSRLSDVTVEELGTTVSFVVVDVLAALGEETGDISSTSG